RRRWGNIPQRTEGVGQYHPSGRQPADRAHERETRSRREERMMCSFNGCWRNDACMGYAAIALGRMNFDLETILAVLHEMHFAFDDTSVEEAAEHLTKIGGGL